MEQRLNLHLRSKTRPDHIPEYVVTAAVKGIRKALREIIHDRRHMNKLVKDHSTTAAHDVTQQLNVRSQKA
jgi:hypothetical protein